MSGEEKIPMRPPEEKPPEEPKYLFDFFEQARRVVIPGRVGDHIYMFKAKEGLYLVDSFYFIKIEDTLFKMGDDENGKPIHERGKILLVATLHDNDDDKDTDHYVRGYTILESEYQDIYENIDDITLYFDAGVAKIFHRYSKEMVTVMNEADEPFEKAWVSGVGHELESIIPEDKLEQMEKRHKDVEYPEYA